MGRLHRVVHHPQYDSANSDHGSWCEAIVVIVVDTLAVEEWIRGHAEPVGAIETVHEQPWATVLRVPLVDGVAWFKACAPVQAFEPHLTAKLFARWPDRVAEVLGYDDPPGALRGVPTARLRRRRRPRGLGLRRPDPGPGALPHRVHRPDTAAPTAEVAGRSAGIPLVIPPSVTRATEMHPPGQGRTAPGQVRPL